MRLLIDTHIALWAVSDVPRLSSVTREAISEADNEVMVSVASLWEIAIKRALGKLSAPDDLREQFALRRVDELAVTGDHAWAAGALPPHHGDPFDRLLIAQAKLERLVLVTSDRRLNAYGVAILW